MNNQTLRIIFISGFSKDFIIFAEALVSNQLTATETEANQNCEIKNNLILRTNIKKKFYEKVLLNDEPDRVNQMSMGPPLGDITQCHKIVRLFQNSGYDSCKLNYRKVNLFS